MTETRLVRHLAAVPSGSPDRPSAPAPGQLLSIADDLTRALTGQVLRPTGQNFEQAIGRIDPNRAHHPAVMVVAADARDVSSVMQMASDHGVAVAVVGTGHSAVAPVQDGVLLTLSGLDSVDINPMTRTALVGAGASWRNVLDAAGAFGLGPICGSAPDVGVIGFLLGGGIGPVSRTYGFGSDQVRRFQVVLASGEIVDVDADHHGDLFWALRGGKANPGVVVLSVEINLLPITEIYGGGLYYAEQDIPAMLHAYQGVIGANASHITENLTTSIAILRIPELPDLPPAISGRTVAHLRIGYIGSPLEAERLLEPLRRAATPVLGTLGVVPCAEIGRIHNDPTALSAHVGGGLLLKELTSSTVEALVRSAGPDVKAPLSIVEIRHLGGALSRPTGMADSVGGRHAAFGVWVSSRRLGPPDSAQGLKPDRAIAAVRSVLDELQPWAAGGTQPNFTGSANTEDEILDGWPVLVRERLREISRRYDPDGTFSGGPGRP